MVLKAGPKVGMRDVQENQTCMKRQKGRDGAIFWAVIMKNQLIGPLRVPERTKIDS